MSIEKLFLIKEEGSLWNPSSDGPVRYPASNEADNFYQRLFGYS